jgi:hypothetical protein
MRFFFAPSALRRFRALSGPIFGPTRQLPRKIANDSDKPLRPSLDCSEITFLVAILQGVNACITSGLALKKRAAMLAY